MLSKAFSKSMKLTYHGVFHSWHCSRICRRVNLCSPQDLPFLNPACSLRSIGSRAVDILFRITLLNTLLVMDNSVIPLQFLQRLRFPFFGSLTISPVFQIYGYFFFFPYFLENLCKGFCDDVSSRFQHLCTYAVCSWRFP